MKPLKLLSLILLFLLVYPDNTTAINEIDCLKTALETSKESYQVDDVLIIGLR